MRNKKGQSIAGPAGKLGKIILYLAVFLVIVFIMITWASPAFGKIIAALPFG